MVLLGSVGDSSIDCTVSSRLYRCRLFHFRLWARVVLFVSADQVRINSFKIDFKNYNTEGFPSRFLLNDQMAIRSKNTERVFCRLGWRICRTCCAGTGVYTVFHLLVWIMLAFYLYR